MLSRKIHGKQIVYLDSTATSLKPKAVIDAVLKYYTHYTANVFRGIYVTSEEATSAFEDARKSVASLIHASSDEIVFVRNTSEALNLLAYTLSGTSLKQGDAMVTTILEHHSNFVPWQQLGARYGYEVKIWQSGSDYLLNIDDLDRLITRKTKVLTITAVSNVTGVIQDIREITKRVKSLNPDCIVIVDGAQAVPHMPVDVSAWGIDALAFSGHKMLGPSGIGVLWAKTDLLNRLPPFLYGGEMITEVHADKTIFHQAPHKFEAGTPFIEGAIGLGAAAEYLMDIGMTEVRKHEIDITRYALKELKKLEYVHVFGPSSAESKGGVVAFTIDGAHPHDIAQLLDQEGICIRAGFHCAQPLHEYLACGPTARASFYIYTTKEDVDKLVLGIQKVRNVFK